MPCTAFVVCICAWGQVDEAMQCCLLHMERRGGEIFRISVLQAWRGMLWSEVEPYTFRIAGEEGDIVAIGGEQLTVFT